MIRSFQLKVSRLGSILFKALSCLLQHEQDELEKTWLLCDELAMKKEQAVQEDGVQGSRYNGFSSLFRTKNI